MKRENFQAFWLALKEREESILATKGEEYTQQSENRLSNFFRSAEECGVSPLQVCYIMLKKQVDALGSYAKIGRCFSQESVLERVSDVRNYALFFAAIAKELEDHHAKV